MEHLNPMYKMPHLLLANAERVLRQANENFSRSLEELYPIATRAFSSIETLHQNKDNLLVELRKAVPPIAPIAAYLNKSSHRSNSASFVLDTAFLQQPTFFPNTAFGHCKDLLPQIISYLDNHNKFLWPTSPSLKDLACVSKIWNHYINEVQASYRAQHFALKAQRAHLLRANHQTIEEAIGFIIENNLEVADLRLFKDLSDELLEKLVKNCPNLKHLMIQSSLITQLPTCCSHQLESLDCNHCGHLTMLPDMTKLTYLNCSFCDELTNLSHMLKIIQLNCSYCKKLMSLPDMPSLTHLDCENCSQISVLPNPSKLIYLDCRWCKQIVSLPDMPHLKSLACLSCQLTSLPAMPNLISLSCIGHFTNLRKFVNLTELQKLTYLDCYTEDDSKIVF